MEELTQESATVFTVQAFPDRLVKSRKVSMH